MCEHETSTYYPKHLGFYYYYYFIKWYILFVGGFNDSIYAHNNANMLYSKVYIEGNTIYNLHSV